MRLRRIYLNLSIISLCLLMLVSFIPAASNAETADNDASQKLEKKHKEMVDRAIKYLVKQQRGDGSITDKGNSNATALTSLSILAMASVGHQPTDETQEGKTMRKAIEYVLRDDRQDKHGYFGGKDNSRMYGHGITTLMLSEMLGMTGDEKLDKEIRRKLEKALELTIRSQRVRKDEKQAGGWRYQPDARDSDLSLTIWQLLSLRSARSAGFDVPASSIEAAIKYLQKSYDSRRDRNGVATNLNSGFTYQPENRDVRFTPTAMGLLAMQVCGEYEAEEVKGAANWLMDRPPKWGERFFFYGLYYYSLGMYQYGEGLRQEGKEIEGDKIINDSFGRIIDILEAKQHRDGSWLGSSDESGQGRVYATTMAVLSLSMKYHYLPIYQR